MTTEEIARLRALCDEATNGSTHWEECHTVHGWCAALRALDEIERLSEALGVTLKELKRHSPVCHAEVLGWIVTDLGLDPDAGTK